MTDDDGPKKAPNEEAEFVSFPFHVKTIEECFVELGCDPATHQKTGLSSEEAARRFEKYGPNQLTEKRKVTIWEKIWNQIANVLVFILMIIAVVSLVSIAIAPTQQYEIASGIQFGLIVFVIT